MNARAIETGARDAAAQEAAALLLYAAAAYGAARQRLSAVAAPYSAACRAHGDSSPEARALYAAWWTEFSAICRPTEALHDAAIAYAAHVAARQGPAGETDGH